MAVIYLPKDERFSGIGQGLGQGFGDVIARVANQKRDAQLYEQIKPFLNPQPEAGADPDAPPPPPDMAKIAPIAAQMSPDGQRGLAMVMQGYGLGMERLRALAAVKGEKAREAEFKAQREHTAFMEKHTLFQEQIEQNNQELNRQRFGLEIERFKHDRELDPLRRQELLLSIKEKSAQVQALDYNNKLMDVANKAPEGDHAFDGLPEGEKTLLTAMKNGDIPPVTATMFNRDPKWQAREAIIRKADPNWSFDVWNTRHKTRIDFTPGGKIGLALGAGDRLVAHMELLNKAYDALANGDSTLANKLFNFVKTQFGSGPMSQFATTNQVVASEARKFFAGSSGGGLTEEQNWEKKFEAAKGPEAAKAALGALRQLMTEQFEEYKDAYNSTMGTGLPITSAPFMQPHTVQRWQQLGIDLGVSDSGMNEGTSTPPSSAGGEDEFKGFSMKPHQGP